MKSFVEKRRKEILIVAILTVAGGFLFRKYGYHWLKGLRYLFLMGFLVVLGFIDREKTIIPNRILLCMLGIRAVLLIGECAVFSEYSAELLKSAGFGMLEGAGIFLVAYLISRGNIGMGDVKLLGVIGAYLGAALIWWDMVVCLFLCAFYSVVQLLRKKLKMKDSIPLAPFFTVGTILILLMGF